MIPRREGGLECIRNKFEVNRLFAKCEMSDDYSMNSCVMISGPRLSFTLAACTLFVPGRRQGLPEIRHFHARLKLASVGGAENNNEQ
jgi:hypothetical protein